MNVRRGIAQASISLAIAIVSLISGTAAAAPFRLLFETVVDASAPSEVVLGTYSSLDDLLTGSPAQNLLPLNVSSAYNIAGFTYDNGLYRVLFETVVDASSPSEVVLGTYSSLNDLLTGSPAQNLLPLNVSSAYNIAGFTYDNGLYRVLFETVVDASSPSEVVLGTYSSLDDLLTGSPAQNLLPLNVSSAYNIAGFTYDNGLYRVLFETVVDASSPSEVVLGTYSSLDDLLTGSPAQNLLPLNVSSAYNIAGFTVEPLPDGGVPEPTTLALVGLGLAGVAFGRRRRALTFN